MTHEKIIEKLNDATERNDISYFQTTCNNIISELMRECFLKEVSKIPGEKARYQAAQKYLSQSKNGPCYVGYTWNYNVYQVFTDTMTFYMLYKPIDNLPLLDPEKIHPDDNTINRLFLTPGAGERKEQKITEEEVKKIITAGKIYKKLSEKILGKNLILFDGTIYNMEFLSTALTILGTERATIETFHAGHMLKISNSYGMAFIAATNFSEEEKKELNKNNLKDLDVITE